MRMSTITYFIVNYSLLNSSVLFILPMLYKSKEEYDKICKVLFSFKVNILLGVFCLISAVLALLFPFAKVILLGDIIPVLVLLLMAFFNLSEFIRQSKYLNKSMIQLSSKILTHIQIPLGIAGLLTAITHILLAHIILL